VIHDSITDVWVVTVLEVIGPRGPAHVYLQVRNGVGSWLVFFCVFNLSRIFFSIFTFFLVRNNVFVSSSPRFLAPETVQNTPKIPRERERDRE